MRPTSSHLASTDLSHLSFCTEFLEESIMKLVSLLLRLNLVTASTAISQNASFIAGEIAQISPCGVRQLIASLHRGDVVNSEYS
jgi:hypothetical protein